MTYPSMAIIGTAGRKDDKDKLNHHSYERMVSATIKLIQHLKIDPNEVKLYSGGAAWADHLVVTLALLGAVPYEHVTVFAPTPLGDTGFVGHDEKSEKTAKTANYYHSVFSRITGKDSIRDLKTAEKMGMILIPGNGNFFSRNSDVAKSVSPDGLLLAFTFGADDYPQDPWTMRGFRGVARADDAGLKDGGTADTFNKCTGDKWHCKLGLTDSNY